MTTRTHKHCILFGKKFVSARIYENHLYFAEKVKYCLNKRIISYMLDIF